MSITRDNSNHNGLDYAFLPTPSAANSERDEEKTKSMFGKAISYSTNIAPL